jgi:hypothetical protein
VDEALMKKRYHDNHFREPLALPARFTSGDIDNFRLELTLISPEIDPADPAEAERVEAEDSFEDFAEFQQPSE